MVFGFSMIARLVHQGEWVRDLWDWAGLSRKQRRYKLQFISKIRMTALRVWYFLIKSPVRSIALECFEEIREHANQRAAGQPDGSKGGPSEFSRWLARFVPARRLVGSLQTLR